MSDLMVFFLSLIASVRTFSYGIKTFQDKNVAGGIFVSILSIFIISLAIYLLFLNRT